MSEPAVIEPGWYLDPFGPDQVERFNDGSRWTGRTRTVGASMETVEPEVRLRSTSLRVVITTSVLVAILGLYSLPLFVPALPGHDWVIGVSIGVFGYLLSVRPVASASIFARRSIVAVVWRLTLLPYREQPVDAAELGVKWRQVVHPKVAGKALYVRIPRKS